MLSRIKTWLVHHTPAKEVRPPPGTAEQRAALERVTSPRGGNLAQWCADHYPKRKSWPN